MITGTNLLSAIQSNSLMLVAFYVLVVIGQWKIFEKAGEEGWKSLIPVYNAYILWKIAGKNFITTLVVAIVLIVVAVILSVVSISNGIMVLGLISSVLMLVFGIYLLCAVCSFCDKLSKAFGHGFGFALGLFLMQPIFLILLGFNKDEYQGVAKK